MVCIVELLPVSTAVSEARFCHEPAHGVPLQTAGSAILRLSSSVPEQIR